MFSRSKLSLDDLESLPSEDYPLNSIQLVDFTYFSISTTVDSIALTYVVVVFEINDRFT